MLRSKKYETIFVFFKQCGSYWIVLTFIKFIVGPISDFYKLNKIPHLSMMHVASILQHFLDLHVKINWKVSLKLRSSASSRKKDDRYACWTRRQTLSYANLSAHSRFHSTFILIKATSKVSKIRRFTSSKKRKQDLARGMVAFKGWGCDAFAAIVIATGT